MVASDQVTLRLIFVNYHSTIELTIDESTPVAELKDIILDSHWPESFVERTEIDHIRLLNGGRELDDANSIHQSHIQIPGGSVIPVHVVPVRHSSVAFNQRSGLSKHDANKDKTTSCWCVIC
jgi:hypothetical protein